MFENCANCGASSLTPVRDALGVFCSRRCRDFMAYPGFCPACLATSTPRSVRGVFTFHGIGTRLSENGMAPCPVCRSVVRTHWVCLFNIPIIRLGRYRVKYTTRYRFLSRSLALDLDAPPPSSMADLEILRQGLHSPNADVRGQCASMLGDRGVEAMAVLPELALLARDPSRRVRTRAKWAIETIRGR